MVVLMVVVTVVLVFVVVLVVSSGGFWWCLVMVMFFPCCMMVQGFLVDFCGSLGGMFWVNVLGIANGGVWGFTPDCFSKVVCCCVGF